MNSRTSTIVFRLIWVAASLTFGACGNGDGDGDGGNGAGNDCPFTLAASEFGITCISPGNGRTNVSTTAPVRVTFSDPVDVDTLQGDIDIRGTIQDFELVWSEDNTVLSIVWTDGAMLANNTFFLEIITIEDLSGRVLANPTSVCFGTGSALDCPSSVECLAHDATDETVIPFEGFEYDPPFAVDSPLNAMIETNPTIASNSNAMITRFADVSQDTGGMWMAVMSSATPIYLADEQTPRHDVSLTDTFAPLPVLEDVPIPAGALPDCGPDRFFVLFDTVGNRFYELYRSSLDGDGIWSAVTGNSISSDSSGIYPGDNDRSSEGIRASGFSLAAGNIWPHELADQRIEHALVCAYSFTRTGPPVAPATANDGQNDDPAAMPLGTLVQLDPDLELDTLALEPYERTIAVALQEYGMYIADTGGGISISVLHAHSFEGNPYDGLLPPEAATDGGLYLQNIPLDRLRVIAPE